MQEYQNSANYIITGKMLKVSYSGVYEDQHHNRIEFSADIEDDIEIHLVGSGNYIKLGKITSVNEYKIPEKMRKIWQVELAMLDTIDAICKKHNIHYFLLHGTLLGAVRHKGFIPWDDDLDIGMLRRDYDKFLEIAPQELSEPYFLQTMWTDRNCFFGGLTKLRNSETAGITERELGHACNLGIWIDILPVDYCTADEKRLAAKERKIKRACRWLYAKVYGNELKRFDQLPLLVCKFMTLVSYFIPYEHLCKKLDRAMRLYTTPSKDVAVFTGAGKHRILNAADFETTAELEFEGRRIPVPAGYENYLFMTLGKDYMKFPPEEERKPKHTGIYDPEHSYREYLQKLTGMFEGSRGKKIILFGSGMMFEDYMKKWGSRYRPVFLVDNDENKWGRSRMGIEIREPDKILEIPEEKRHLIICSFYYKEIEKQLQEMGITEYRVYVQKLEWIIKAEGEAGLTT